MQSNRIYCSDPCRKNASDMRRYIKKAYAEGRTYHPRYRRPALTSVIGERPYRIPREDDER